MPEVSPAEASQNVVVLVGLFSVLALLLAIVDVACLVSAQRQAGRQRLITNRDGALFLSMALGLLLACLHESRRLAWLPLLRD